MNELLNLDNFDYGFGSSAANLEYSILSSMLGGGSSQIIDTDNTNNWKSTTDNLYSGTPSSVYSNPVLGDPSSIFSQQKADHLIQDSPKSNVTPTPFISLRKSSSTSMSYAKASKPFSYADGYHYLINYVKQKCVP
jgi:hypothetical protein